MADSHHRTPVQIIRRALLDWIDHSPMTETTVAAAIRDLHEAMYSRHQTTIEWSQHPDPAARMEADRKHVWRWFEKGVARLPAEIYDVMVMVLPGERRYALEQALAAERAGVFVALPAVRGPGLVHMGAMAKETSEAIAAVGALFEDGALDERDAAIAPAALAEISHAMAKLLEMRAEIEHRALGRPREVRAPFDDASHLAAKH